MSANNGRFVSFFVLALGAALMAPVARGSIVLFSGTDPGANSTSPRPNSNTAASNFDIAAAALGTVNVITFESAPVGNFTNLLVAPGVTVSGQSILNVPFASPESFFGYNTTSGGANYAFLNGGSLTFTFATPVSAFGAYISGLQLAGETLNFNDGASQSLVIPNPGGGLLFIGFTDVGRSISSITVNTATATIPTGDFVGVDDVRYVSAAAASVPEPASIAMIGSALAGLALWRKRLPRGHFALSNWGQLRLSPKCPYLRY